MSRRDKIELAAWIFVFTLEIVLTVWFIFNRFSLWPRPQVYTAFPVARETIQPHLGFVPMLRAPFLDPIQDVVMVSKNRELIFISKEAQMVLDQENLNLEITSDNLRALIKAQQRSKR